MRILRIVFAATFAVAGFTPAASAQSTDPEKFLKWAGATVVHYDVVAEYSRVTQILTGGSFGRWRETAVKDRFEVSFDWNPSMNAFVGKPVFKNAPSTVGTVFEGACRQPKIDGPYEHLEILEAKGGHLELELTIRRVYPGGASPYLNENGVCGMEALGPKAVAATHVLAVVPGSAFAMPQFAPKHVRVGEQRSATGAVIVGKDEKTIVVDDTATNGWKYTYTLKIVQEGGGLK